MAVIEVRGLTKRFGPVQAVNDLSFDVDGGTVTGFLGPNGAGKTTTLRMLLGLVKPAAGTAVINGRTYAQLPGRLHHVGAVLEASGIHPAGPPAITCGSARRRAGSAPAGWTPCSSSWISPTPGTSGQAAFPSGCASGLPSPQPCSATPRS
jgi:energy-coupling factor transporter ATP-binding protein EcfA2